MALSPASIEIRHWQKGDEEVLPQLASNRAIWRNLTNRFPFPYERQDAVDWIRNANREPENAQHFAIVTDGAVVGGVGFERLQDLSTRTAEIGYWIGEAFWGRGSRRPAGRRRIAQLLASRRRIESDDVGVSSA